jgi:hypothetical protein
MHEEKAQNRWSKEVIMEGKMRVLEGPGEIHQLCKKKKVAPHGDGDERKRRPQRLLLLRCLL